METEKALKEFKNPGPPVNLLLDALRDRLAGRMTQEELTENCLRWSFHYALKQLEYRPLPPIPLFYTTFLHLTLKQREKIWQEDVTQRDRILEYISTVSRIKHENEANKDWLKKMLRFFNHLAETLKVEAIQRVLEGYDGKVTSVS